MTDSKQITIEGKQYEVETLSDRVKQLISIHQKWDAAAGEQKLELAKSEAAIRDITREIVNAVRSEDADKAAAAAAAYESGVDAEITKTVAQ